MKKGNLYYYFRDKEEILFACHQYSLDRLLILLEEVETSKRTPEEKLRHLIVSFAHTILDELHGTALFLNLEALKAAHLKAVIVRRDQFDRGMRRVIEEGMQTGAFGRVDAKLLSFAILGAINWIPRWYQPRRGVQLTGNRGAVLRLPDRRLAAGPARRLIAQTDAASP